MADMIHKIDLAVTPAKVFQALATQEGLQGWWTGDTEASPQIGSIATFGFGNRSTVFRLRIDELAPGKKVAWTCLGDHPEWERTRLTFALEESASKGTTLVFRHDGWRSTEGWFGLCNTTWGALMYRLKEFVEEGSPVPFFMG